MTWFLTLHRWTKPLAEARPLVPEHRAWVLAQQRLGRVVVSGPTPDLSLGIMVFRADSQEEVEEALATEPFVAGGYRTVEVIPWQVHELLGFDLHVNGVRPAS